MSTAKLNDSNKKIDSSLESYFSRFRDNVIGINDSIDTPYGTRPLVYADWIASGRMYNPIESKFVNDIFPVVANTHTNTTYTGSVMTLAYEKARNIIKAHVNASPKDVLITEGSGMTGVVNKFQRILGLKIHENYKQELKIEDRPLIICTHMEHHSNQTSWLETIANVVVVNPDNDGKVCCNELRKVLDEYADTKLKIAAVTSCSNVTGIFSPYHDIAEIMHEYGGLCFVDFACSAPYIDIDMHPENRPKAYLDAIYFSPHKFLGGPGSSGVLLFNKELYKNEVPDNPGGGTVDWTNPWGEHKYFDEIEAREDGGTPAFLQTIRVAQSIVLKDMMSTKKIIEREHELLNLIWDDLLAIDNVHVLADNIKDRLSVISFYIHGLHYNLAVRLLNDRYGIQTRGGCSCAGTYGHYLLHVTQEKSKRITDTINHGDCSLKPGWVRFSLHPVMTDQEAIYILEAIRELAANHKEWSNDYVYNGLTNEFDHRSYKKTESEMADSWFRADLV